jgi:threonyl-tRNA synthetase
MQEFDSLIAAEVLALSVCDLFPGTQLVESKATSLGFFYDFLIEQPIDQQALPLLEEKMRAVIKEDLQVEVLDMMRENAAQLFLHYDQSFKSEALLEAESNIVQILRIGKFHDYIVSTDEELLVGNSTTLAGAIKLVSIARIDRYIENVGDLAVVRIEGIAASDKQILKKAYKKYEAAKACDPIQLGQEMELFVQHPTLMPGSLIWQPKGAALREHLLQIWKTITQKQGFQSVTTPGFVQKNEKNRAERNTTSTFVEMEEIDYLPLPDKASLHAAYVSSQVVNIQELPLRLAEISERFESLKEIEINGLHQSRVYTADNIEVFCQEEQVQQELISYLQFFDKTFRILDFEYQWYLVALRSKASIGTPAEWKQNAAWLTKALDASGFSYHHENRQSANQGPRIELRLRDPLDREWVASWLEINALCTKQFDLRYQGNDSKMHRLVMISGSLYSSLERLVALLIERYRGELPLWLAPEQIRLLPMGERHMERAQTVSTTMKNDGFRVKVDPKNESLGCKVHAAVKARVPYIVILGDKENKEEIITVRSCNQSKTVGMKLEELLTQLKIELDRQKEM